MIVGHGGSFFTLKTSEGLGGMLDTSFPCSTASGFAGTSRPSIQPYGSDSSVPQSPLVK
jgi:hypothetical protein